MLGVLLDKETAYDLKKLVQLTGQSETIALREAVAYYLEVLLDALDGDSEYEEVEYGKGWSLPKLTLIHCGEKKTEV